MGRQTVLNVSLKMWKYAQVQKGNVKVLSTQIDILKATEDCEHFSAKLKEN